jgi:hypothetical protein
MGAAVGLAQVTCRDGVTAKWLREGGFSVRTGRCGDALVRLQLGPLYDPRRIRILI